MPITPVYGLPYHSLTDIPQGAALGRDLADAVEAQLERIDDTIGAKVQQAQIAYTSVLITPVANTATSGALSWGKTLSAPVHVVVCPETAVPGSPVIECTVNTITTTGALAWVYRTNTTQTRVHAIAVGGL